MVELMAAEWKDVLEALNKVPSEARNDSWKKTVELIHEILDGVCSVMMPANPKELRWAPACNLCRGPISFDQDYVFKSISGTMIHYDCFYKSTEGEMA